MNTDKYTVLTGDHFDMYMVVGDDCVVFSAKSFRCLGEGMGKNAIRMAQEAKKAGKQKVVVIGDCDEHDANAHAREGKLAKVMDEAGLEWIWLWQECPNILNAYPDFDRLGVRRFSDAKGFNLIRLMLDARGKKIGSTSAEISHENSYLAKYPVVARVAGLESHDHNKLLPFGLFGNSDGYREIVSREQLVCLFREDLDGGILVHHDAHSENYTDFEVAQAISPECLFEGKHGGYVKGKGCSVRIKFKRCDLEFSLYLYPGRWVVERHPDPSGGYESGYGDLKDCGFIPMFRRVAQQKA